MGSGEPYVVIFFQKLGGTLAADPRVIGNLGGSVLVTHICAMEVFAIKNDSMRTLHRITVSLPRKGGQC